MAACQTRKVEKSGAIICQLAEQRTDGGSDRADSVAFRAISHVFKLAKGQSRAVAIA